MHVNFDLQHPDEMEAFAAFLTTSAKSRRDRPKPVGLFGLDLANNPLWKTAAELAAKDSLTREAEDATPEVTEPAADSVLDRVKRTRRTKAEIEAANKATETVANLDPEVVAEAAAAGVNVQGPAFDMPAEDEQEDVPDKQVSEQPALTENDVRNSIIDLLNEAQAKFPDDADIRTKTLKPLLEKLGAPKISSIPMTEYPRVAGLLAEVRQQMAEAA